VTFCWDNCVALRQVSSTIRAPVTRSCRASKRCQENPLVTVEWRTFAEPGVRSYSVRVSSNLLPISRIGVFIRKGEQRYCHIGLAIASQADKADPGIDRLFARHEVAVMRTAMTFDEFHPDPSIGLELRNPDRIDAVADFTGDGGIGHKVHLP